MFALMIVISAPAYAYIDPGTGLLVLQGLFAVVGAALTFMRKPWVMIASFINLKKKKKENAGPKGID
jgi:hypothetical protein